IKPEEIEDRTRSKTSFVQQKYPKQWYQHRQHHDVCGNQKMKDQIYQELQ
ncbi:2491_t:CDS:1, partial [Entrophospora sp. SA101]